MRCALFALALAVLPAQAATTQDIFALYAKGDYDAAARVGEAAHTPQGLAIAARAVLADDVLRETPCLECVQRAERLARAAIAADPHFAYGQVWLAVSLGYQSRIIGIVKARLADMPAQSKAALDTAVHDDPNNAFAVSALGNWHIEVVKGGGAFLARTLYGARESEAIALFDRAEKVAPGNVAVRYQIALALLGYDAARFHARIVTELRAAVAATPQTAYEKRVQDRANDMLGLVNHGPEDALATKLRKYQGFPD
jgi:tetratricopeptide (TPR) repeat protein